MNGDWKEWRPVKRENLHVALVFMIFMTTVKQRVEIHVSEIIQALDIAKSL